MLGST
jgi:hypothetical protein